VLDSHDIYVMPSMNPDGYEYTRNYDRMWRKTRSKNPGTTCRGADPNRNWGYRWGEKGASTNPCSEIYR
jgi:carboxypeptidase A4